MIEANGEGDALAIDADRRLTGIVTAATSAAPSVKPRRQEGDGQRHPGHKPGVCGASR